MDRIYLDYAATTPVDPQVIQTMIPFFESTFGNPSSLHYFGQAGESAILKARNQLLTLMGAHNADLVFTSGGTESDNLALRGVVSGNLINRKKTMFYSPVEHPAITSTCTNLHESAEIEIRKLRVDKYGMVDPKDLLNNIDSNSILVSVIWGNNEIGSINDIESLSKVCRSKGVLFHTDAVQAMAHLELSWDQLDIDMLSFGAHKFYGPKGVGGLIVRRGIRLQPQNTGGSQEEGLRAGTQNVPLIMGMAKAYELINLDREERNRRLTHLRNMIIDEVLHTIPGAYLTGHPEKRLPNHASFVFEGISGQDLIIGLDMAGFAVSSGSACKVGNPKPSEVLLAIGIPENLAKGALRVTVGKHTNENEVNSFITTLKKLVNELRKKD